MDAQTRKPGARKSFLKPAIVVTDCSSGALRAKTTDPIIHSVQPIQPYLLDGSLWSGKKDVRRMSSFL
jgi:hypothetical protein